MDLKETVKNILFDEKENGKKYIAFWLKEQEEMQMNCCVYKTVKGEIDCRFNPRSHCLSIIQVNCLRTKIQEKHFF